MDVETVVSASITSLTTILLLLLLLLLLTHCTTIPPQFESPQQIQNVRHVGCSATRCCSRSRTKCSLGSRERQLRRTRLRGCYLFFTHTYTVKHVAPSFVLNHETSTPSTSGVIGGGTRSFLEAWQLEVKLWRTVIPGWRTVTNWFWQQRGNKTFFNPNFNREMTYSMDFETLEAVHLMFHVLLCM